MPQIYRVLSFLKISVFFPVHDSVCVCVCVCVCCTLIEVCLVCSFPYYRHIMSWCVGGVRLSSLAPEPLRHDSLSSQLCDF